VAALVLCLGSGAAGAALVDDRSGTATVPTAGAPAVPVATGEDGAVGLASVAAAVQPSVVSIRVQTRQGGGEGSGVVLRDDGMILTNNHVVAGAADGGSLSVTFANGDSAPATVIGTDPATDLAVIQVSDVPDLVPATFADGDELVVGDPVLAIGSPLGLEGSVTAGIVSALHRTVDLGSSEAGTSSVLADAIQTDAAINPGNSGGALVDGSGRVIGINTAIASLGSSTGTGGSIGLGFAIPVAEATSVAEALMAGKQPTHAVLGVNVQSTPDGTLVQSVTPGGAAAKAGLRTGDVLLRIEDRPVEDGNSLAGIIRSFDPGKSVTVTYRRDGAQRTVDVVLASATS